MIDAPFLTALFEARVMQTIVNGFQLPPLPQTDYFDWMITVTVNIVVEHFYIIIMIQVDCTSVTLHKLENRLSHEMDPRRTNRKVR